MREDRRLFDRRKRDRGWRFWAALLGVVAVFGTVAFLTLHEQGCGSSDSSTGPSPVVLSTPVPPPVPAPKAPVAADPTPDPNVKNPGPTEVDCENGVCTFTTSDGNKHNVWIHCTPNGLNDDWGSKVVQAPGSITDDEIKANVCDPKKISIPEFHCNTIKKVAQIDFNGGKDSEHIGHTKEWLEYPPNPEIVDLPDISGITYEYGDWTACHLPETVESDRAPKTCEGVQEQTVVKITSTIHRTKNTCTGEVTRSEPVITREKQPDKTQACTIENEPTGDPTPGPYTWDERILEGQCDKEVLPLEPQVLTVEDGLNCHITGEQTIYDHTICGNFDHVRHLCKNVECPPPPHPDLCYYNVPGSLGKFFCQQQPGYESWEDENHLCSLDWPGVDLFGFNLNPGQSGTGCLKHTGGPF